MNNFLVFLTATMIAGAIIGALVGWASCRGDEERDRKFCWIKFSKYVIFCTVGLIPSIAFLFLWYIFKRDKA